MVKCCHSYKIFSHSRFKERFLKSGFFQIPLKGIWKVSHSASGHSLKIRTLELNHFDKHFRNKTNRTKNISPSGSFSDKWLSIPRKHIFFLFEVWEMKSFLNNLCVFIQLLPLQHNMFERRPSAQDRPGHQRQVYALLCFLSC